MTSSLSIFMLLATGVLTFHAIWISWMDFRRMIIPDLANLSLGFSGLSWQLLSGQPVLWQLMQVTFGGMLFWLVRYLYVLVRQRQGLGMGDVKFAAAACAWVGLLGLPWFVLFASMSALTFILIRQIRGQLLSANTRIAFGPHLCVGLLATWLSMAYGKW
jgi:leader peptidase (prepilin peptidase) / N-methyltransferase